MATFSVFKDFEAPTRSGADGLFQIVSVKDENDNDVTNSFDQCKFYRDNAQLANDIATKFNLPLNQIDIQEDE